LNKTLKENQTSISYHITNCSKSFSYKKMDSWYVPSWMVSFFWDLQKKNRALSIGNLDI